MRFGRETGRNLALAFAVGCACGPESAPVGDAYDVWRDMQHTLRTSPDHRAARADALVTADDTEGLFAFVRDEIALVPGREGYVLAATEGRWGAAATLRGGAGTARERVDLLAAVRKLVLVSDLGPFHRLADYLAKRAVERTGIVLGVPLLRELFNESHYRDLGGGILEAFGRLFNHAVRLYVYPTRDPIDGRKITADNLKVAPHLAHLLQHLLGNGLVRSIPCEDSQLRTYSSEEVRSRICSGDESWKDLVDPAVARVIERTGYFGARCDLPSPGGR